MKNNDIICNKTILENEVIEETNKELDELKSIFKISVDKMTDKQRRIADMYVEKMLEEADDLINSILDQFFILLYYIAMTTKIIRADDLSVSKYFTFNNQNYYADLSDVF